MKIFIFCLLLLFICLDNTQAQKKVLKTIDQEVSQAQLESHINFIASDELLGRNTGTQENAIVTRYIAEQFRKFGLIKPPGYNSYLQAFPLRKITPLSSGFIKVKDSTYAIWDQLVMKGNDLNATATMMFVDSDNLEVNLENMKDKIVFFHVPRNELSKARNLIAKEKPLSMIGLIRDFGIWPGLVNSWSSHRTLAYNVNTFGVRDGYLLDSREISQIPFLTKNSGSKANINLVGGSIGLATASNVLGIVEGSDPLLKNEYVIVSAHLDHIGYARGISIGEDSIYNGARDDGIGTGNLLLAAEYFAKHPSKRSIIFLAANAEEKGLVGSKWYVENPALPLKSIIANINTDTDGYNDTSSFRITGLNKTTMEDLFLITGTTYNLKVYDDETVIPNQNLYRRSDNFSFANKGIPSVTFAPGATSWDEEIEKYYHQTADNPETLNYTYLTKLSKAFIYSIYLVANAEERPFWVEGDEFEEAGKALYGME
ncbi:MAG: M28 family metallopeptidase [Bacteroidota bacterium]